MVQKPEQTVPAQSKPARRSFYSARGPDANVSAAAVWITRHPHRLRVCLAENIYRDVIMKRLIYCVALALVWTGAQCDFSCPDGSKIACLDAGDKVCPASGRCVDNNAVCFDQFPCDANEGFVCESKYDAVMKDCKEAAQEHNALAKQSVALREQRLAQKNCVLDASTLAEARKCVL